jgi:hypothetical protein
MDRGPGLLVIWTFRPFFSRMSSHAAPLLAVLTIGCGSQPRPFVDRPVAWSEHDDEDVPRSPKPSELGSRRVAIGLFDLFIREVDRALSIEWRRPADDVNALDEVPCSTWFCPRNHLEARLTPEAVAAGPPEAVAPVVPLKIRAGNEAAAEFGFDVIDAAGRHYRLKFDPPGHPGLATGAEAVAQRLFWAAGYNTPGAFVVELGAGDLAIADGATILHHGYDRRPFTAAALGGILANVARTPDGRIRAVAVATPEGTAIGAFDFTGRRGDDPNDRIPHQHRRSLRASLVLAAWIGAAAMSAADTQDVWVAGDGRHFVRHYFRDFSATFGASWIDLKGPWQGEERILDFSRQMKALVLLGLFRRSWQGKRDDWEAALRDAPALGWYVVEGWRPDRFRTAWPLPAYVRMTDRDGYWGAKVVTAFTDEQIGAAVGAGRFAARDAARLERVLRTRRDAIGRHWLRRLTAVEQPALSPGGAALCFRDVAIERGAARAGGVRYTVVAGGERRWFHAHGPRSCLPLPLLPRDYAVITVVSRVDGVLARAARVHLAWRSGQSRFVVVGLDRDE